MCFTVVVFDSWRALLSMFFETQCFFLLDVIKVDVLMARPFEIDKKNREIEDWRLKKGKKNKQTDRDTEKMGFQIGGEMRVDWDASQFRDW